MTSANPAHWKKRKVHGVRNLPLPPPPPFPRPHVLLGDGRSQQTVRILKVYGWGRMWVDRVPRPYPGEPWALDNGAWRDFCHNRPFDGDLFLRRLERAYPVPGCMLAVIPDIVAGGAKSLDTSASWLSRLPHPWPWFLAVQNGMELHHVAPLLADPRIAGLFLGGDNDFKRDTAAAWCDLAHAHGRRFHYARATGTKRFGHACRVGADSIDGTTALRCLDDTARFLAAYCQHQKEFDFQ